MKLSLHIPKHHHTYSNQDTVFHRILNDPYVDWALTMIISLVAVCLLIGAGFYVYFDTKHELTLTTNNRSTAVPSLFNAKAFAAILKEFDARASERTKIIDGYSGLGDPSR